MNNPFSLNSFATYIFIIAIFSTVLFFFGHLDGDVWIGTVILVPIVLFIYLMMWILGFYEEDVEEGGNDNGKRKQ